MTELVYRLFLMAEFAFELVNDLVMAVWLVELLVDYQVLMAAPDLELAVGGELLHYLFLMEVICFEFVQVKD